MSDFVSLDEMALLIVKYADDVSDFVSLDEMALLIVKYADDASKMFLKTCVFPRKMFLNVLFV